MISPEDVTYICEQYGLGHCSAVDSITEGVLNDNYVFTTDSGKYFIKSVREKIRERLSVICGVETWMKSQGIPALAMLKTVSGEICMKSRGALYTVYNYVESDRTHKYSLDDYRNMGIMLGKIHRVGSEKHPISLNNKDFNRPASGVILERLNDYKKKILEKKLLDEVDRMMLEYIDFKIKWIPTLEMVSLPNDTITHGDYQAGNILIDTTSREIIGICDWEKTEFAPRSYEVARSIFYICLEDKLTLADALEATKEFVTGYRAVYSMEKDELMKGIKMRVEKMFLSAWMEDMYYNQHSDRANHFIENETRIMKLVTQENLYKGLESIM